MFDLGQSIAERRRQMSGAGIKKTAGRQRDIQRLASRPMPGNIPDKSHDLSR